MVFCKTSSLSVPPLQGPTSKYFYVVQGENERKIVILPWTDNTPNSVTIFLPYWHGFLGSTIMPL